MIDALIFALNLGDTDVANKIFDYIREPFREEVYRSTDGLLKLAALGSSYYFLPVYDAMKKYGQKGLIDWNETLNQVLDIAISNDKPEILEALGSRTSGGFNRRLIKLGRNIDDILLQVVREQKVQIFKSLVSYLWTDKIKRGTQIIDEILKIGNKEFLQLLFDEIFPNKLPNVDPEIIKKLVVSGVEINKVYNMDVTPFEKILHAKNYDLARFLIDNGANYLPEEGSQYLSNCGYSALGCISDPIEYEKMKNYIINFEANKIKSSVNGYFGVLPSDLLRLIMDQFIWDENEIIKFGGPVYEDFYDSDDSND